MRSNIKKRFLLFAILFNLIIMLLPSMSMAAVTLTDTRHLFELLNERLSYMRAIAAYKYVNHLPIYVPSQERLEIQAAKQQAERLHLNPSTVEQMMAVQIAMGKQIERAWIKHWQETGFPKKDLVVVDLKVIRPKIIELNNEILQEIVVTQPLFHDNTQFKSLRHQAMSIIDTTYVTEANKLKILTALKQIH